MRLGSWGKEDQEFKVIFDYWLHRKLRGSLNSRDLFSIKKRKIYNLKRNIGHIQIRKQKMIQRKQPDSRTIF